MPTRFTPSRNFTDGDTTAAGNTTGSLHQVTGSLRITGSLFVNGVLLTGSGGGGGGGSPGGASGDVQFNDGSGGFDGQSNFNFDGSGLPILTTVVYRSTGSFFGGAASALVKFGNDGTVPGDFCRIIRTTATPGASDSLIMMNDHGPLVLSGSGPGWDPGAGGILLKSAVSASSIKMSGSTDIPDALVIGPTFDFTPFGMGMVHAPGLISVPSSSHPIGFSGFMAWGPDGPGASQPVTQLNSEGLKFVSASTSWMLADQPPPLGIQAGGIEFSGTSGFGGGGPSFTSHPEEGVTIAPTFPPGGFGPQPFYAPGLIAIESSSMASGMWILGDDGPVMMLNPGSLTFSGSNTTSSTDIHPLVQADMFQTSNGAISIGVIGDPDGPGGDPTIYQSGTLVINSGTHNKLLIQGPGNKPVINMSTNGLMFSASSEGGALGIVNGPLMFMHPAVAPIDFSQVGNSAARINMPDNVEEALSIQVDGDSPWMMFKTTNATESAAIFKPLGVGHNAGDPPIALDVHYTASGSPINLGNQQGGGEVIYFGTGSIMNVGGVHYLNSDGGWAPANANVVGTGHNQLLGIPMGSDPSSDGVLVKGYFNVSSSHFIEGFIKGGPVYVWPNTAPAQGKFTGSAPTGSNEYVRVVGYGTTDANIIYFNPDATYVELA